VCPPLDAALSEVEDSLECQLHEDNRIHCLQNGLYVHVYPSTRYQSRDLDSSGRRDVTFKAVAVSKENEIVGHVPFNISSVISVSAKGLQ
jgi:hypothetical protein